MKKSVIAMDFVMCVWQIQLLLFYSNLSNYNQAKDAKIISW